MSIRPLTGLVAVLCRLLGADRRCEPCRLVAVTRRLPERTRPVRTPVCVANVKFSRRRQPSRTQYGSSLFKLRRPPI